MNSGKTTCARAESEYSVFVQNFLRHVDWLFVYKEEYLSNSIYKGYLVLSDRGYKEYLVLSDRETPTSGSEYF